MSQKSTAVELQDNSGNQVRAVSHESDYPLPPVAELEKLHQFRPDLVDKVFEMTKEEAKYRRERMLQIDRYLFCQNLVSNIGAVLVALLAFSGAIYLGSQGYEKTAIGLVCSTLGVVVYAIKKASK